MPVAPEPGCLAVELGDVTVDAVACCSPSIATSTLCTPTGPIAVLVATACGDCDTDTGDPQQVGWVDLGTGVFTAGNPPADAGPCATTEPCEPTPMCARLASVTGPDVWTAPAGIESLSLHVTAGPVTVTDCAAEATVLPEGCGTLSWSAPPTSCAPGVLCGPFTVTVPDGSSVLVNWLEPCP